MRVLFAGGGTAGHINPALAIANYIKDLEPSSEILYVGKKGAMEEVLVNKAKINFAGIVISGFSRKKNLKGLKDNLVTVKRLISSLFACKKILKDFEPDFCVGTGGYVSGPVLWQAARLKIPIFIHEQNAFPGMTTKILSKKAKMVFLGMEDAQKYLGNFCKTKYVGNPVRKEIITAVKETSRKILGLDERPVVLSFGGSLGSDKINQSILKLILYTAKSRKIQHVHAYGKNGRWFKSELRKSGINLEEYPNLIIKEYLDSMHLFLSSADLVICRSGAISISELAIQGKPSILIPSPNVTANHQYFNAKSLSERGAAILLEEKDLTASMFIKLVNNLLKNNRKMRDLKTEISKLAILDSAKKIFENIKEVISEKNN